MKPSEPKGGTKMKDRPSGSKYEIRAVGAAFKVLGALADTPKQTLSQLASTLEMTNSLTYRMLVTLEGEAMVYRDQNRRYSLGPRAMYLGYQAQRSLPLNELAQPAIDYLVETTAETVHLAIRWGLERVIVAMRESPQAVRVSTPIGTKFPLYYGGTGLCIFAFLTPDEQDAVLRHDLRPRTPITVVDPVTIRETAGLIKQRGYHVAVGDFANSAFSVAAPIFGSDNEIIGSISVAGPDSRLTDDSRPHIIEHVVRAGKEVSAALGNQVALT